MHQALATQAVPTSLYVSIGKTGDPVTIMGLSSPTPTHTHMRIVYTSPNQDARFSVVDLGQIRQQIIAPQVVLLLSQFIEHIFFVLIDVRNM